MTGIVVWVWQTFKRDENTKEWESVARGVEDESVELDVGRLLGMSILDGIDGNIDDIQDYADTNHKGEYRFLYRCRTLKLPEVRQ